MEPFCVPEEQKTTVLPTQFSEKAVVGYSGLKLESCSNVEAKQERPFPPGESLSSFISFTAALSAAYQLQGVEAPEIEGRVMPLGEGLDPNQDI